VGIIDRIKLNARANLNYILDKAEDPERMLNQFMMEMRESVREVKESVATAIVGVKKLEREIVNSAENATQWEERAILALKKDNEELARKALEQKHTFLENERSLKEELEKQKQTVAELKASLVELEAKMEGMYQKRSELVKEHERLKMKAAQTPVAKPVVSDVTLDTSAFDVYDRMVDKVRTMEAQAEALAELAEMNEVESEFRKLERESSVAAELKSMKEKTQA